MNERLTTLSEWNVRHDNGGCSLRGSNLLDGGLHYVGNEGDKSTCRTLCTPIAARKMGLIRDSQELHDCLRDEVAGKICSGGDWANSHEPGILLNENDGNGTSPSVSEVGRGCMNPLFEWYHAPERENYVSHD